MSIISDYAAAIVLACVIFVTQLTVITLAGPDTTLYQTVESAQHLNATQRADFYYKVAVLWGPTIAYVVLAAFPIVRAYRRQAATARTRPP
jgi:hypothetical protein